MRYTKHLLVTKNETRLLDLLEQMRPLQSSAVKGLIKQCGTNDTLDTCLLMKSEAREESSRLSHIAADYVNFLLH